MSMEPSNAKKRRLAALNQYRAACGPGNEQPVAQQAPAQQPAAVATTAADSAATAPNGSQSVGAAAGEINSFPYNRLTATLALSSTASKLRITETASCRGGVDDILEHLMIANMPPTTARNMISSRTIDKSVVLDNPTAKLNITKPSSASKGKHHRLAGKLLPRAKRNELCQLPACGIDYAALLPLHELWGKYVSNVLSTKPDPERLLQALDWHGAVLRVVSHKNPIYVGRAGIVAKATANTFVLVAPDGRSSIVPLKAAEFECTVPGVNQTVTLSSSGSLAKLQCKLVPGDSA